MNLPRMMGRLFFRFLSTVIAQRRSAARWQPAEVGQLFCIAGGDGDPKFFSEPKILKLVDAPWFRGRVLRGEGLLFQIEGGVHAGDYVVVTSRTLAPIEAHIAKYGWASVVVHKITNPTTSFDGNEMDAEPVGMAFIERLDAHEERTSG